MSGQETSNEVVKSVVGRGALPDDTHAVFGPICNKRIGPSSFGGSESISQCATPRALCGGQDDSGGQTGRTTVCPDESISCKHAAMPWACEPGLARMRPLGATGASLARARGGRKVPVARFARRGRRERRRSGEATSGSLGACRSENEVGVMARDAEPSNAGRAGGGPRLRGPKHRASARFARGDAWLDDATRPAARDRCGHRRPEPYGLETIAVTRRAVWLVERPSLHAEPLLGGAGATLAATSAPELRGAANPPGRSPSYLLSAALAHGLGLERGLALDDLEALGLVD